MRSLLKSPFPRLIVFKKKENTLSLSPSLRVPFLQILLFPRNVVGAKKGGGKKKRSKARKRVTFYRDVYGDVCSSRFSVNSGRAALFVSLPLSLYIYIYVSLSLSLEANRSVRRSRAPLARRNTDEITPEVMRFPPTFRLGPSPLPPPCFPATFLAKRKSICR